MVIANVALAVRSSSNLIRRSTKSIELSDEELSKKLTHAYLQEKCIEKIGDLSQCENVTVVFLQDNFITKIENLNELKNLTHLYLQNNSIQKIENLEQLHNLTKLYLNNNQIAVVENLHNNEKLSELHIQNQNLIGSEQLLFEPKTLQTLSKCVQILNISKNNIDNLLDLTCLHQLVTLNASNNQLSNLNETVNVIKCLPHLSQLDLSLNPICKSPHYRKRITTVAAYLEVLDNKEVSITSKVFLQRLHKRKSEQMIRFKLEQEMMRKKRSDAEMNFPICSSLEDEANKIIESTLRLY